MLRKWFDNNSDSLLGQRSNCNDAKSQFSICFY
jgi:hypothetical protein